MLDVSCIIINYNTSEYTVAAVSSILEKHDELNQIEIIVIDNASKKEDYLNLKSSIDLLNRNNIKVVRSNLNIGFGAGNMLGVEHASECSYYAFINNDTLQISNNCLMHLKNFMESTPDAGVCSPQMLDENMNFRVTLDHFSSLQREILRRPLLETLFPKTYLNPKIEYAEATKVHYVQGSFMFVNAEDFIDIGGFDKNLFLFYEESDVALRFLRQKGKYNYLIPSVQYIHYKSASIAKNIDIKIEQKISLLYYIRKHFGWGQQKLLNTYYVIRYFFTSIVKPKYWKLFKVLLAGAPMSYSLKHKQHLNETL